jgi:enoyl-CoA hydratase/carnithine racemase
MVLACDLAVAAPHARFALPELSHGLVPLAGMHLLPRQIGRKAAMAILLAGKALSAAEALDLGLINEVATDRPVLDVARVLAERIVQRSPAATATCLDIVQRSLATPDVFDALDAPYQSLEALRASADFREGPLAFAEGRKPRWSQPTEE